MSFSFIPGVEADSTKIHGSVEVVWKDAAGNKILATELFPVNNGTAVQQREFATTQHLKFAIPGAELDLEKIQGSVQIIWKNEAGTQVLDTELLSVAVKVTNCETSTGQQGPPSTPRPTITIPGIEVDVAKIQGSVQIIWKHAAGTEILSTELFSVNGVADSDTASVSQRESSGVHQSVTTPDDPSDPATVQSLIIKLGPIGRKRSAPTSSSSGTLKPAFKKKKKERVKGTPSIASADSSRNSSSLITSNEPSMPVTSTPKTVARTELTQTESGHGILGQTSMGSIKDHSLQDRIAALRSEYATARPSGPSDSSVVTPVTTGTKTSPSTALNCESADTINDRGIFIFASRRSGRNDSEIHQGFVYMNLENLTIVVCHHDRVDAIPAAYFYLVKADHVPCRSSTYHMITFRGFLASEDDRLFWLRMPPKTQPENYWYKNEATHNSKHLQLFLDDVAKALR
ncbi:hypothetical protein BU16DRAFT_599604 [Lophium mytilinum]|uniref:Uncharacterized protein n=1 Tax=Lophium mytilinum TaxID=390894 RepID=A0A6A6RCY6_9PEZI|nr:hypothetical protein BU16DRAFT_599604 [Lophium mytilinum]